MSPISRGGTRIVTTLLAWQRSAWFCCYRDTSLTLLTWIGPTSVRATEVARMQRPAQAEGNAGNAGRYRHGFRGGTLALSGRPWRKRSVTARVGSGSRVLVLHPTPSTAPLGTSPGRRGRPSWASSWASGFSCRYAATDAVGMPPTPQAPANEWCCSKQSLIEPTQCGAPNLDILSCSALFPNWIA